MSGFLIGLAVGCGLLIALVRRRRSAIALFALQSLALGMGAIAVSTGYGESSLAAVALVLRGISLPALLALLRRRTPEPRPVAAALPVSARLLLVAGSALLAAAWLPDLGTGDRAAEQGAIALVAIGIAVVALRRPTLFQAIGLLIAENGAYLLAASIPGGVPGLIELGIAFDLVAITAVVIAFSFRIHRELGSGDTDLLRGLRD